jgi:hypothetical protein
MLPFLRHFLLYSYWSLGFPFSWPLWLVTAALVANLGLALMRMWPVRRDRWRMKYWLVLFNFLFFPATVAIAVVGTVPIDVPQRKNLPALWTTEGMFYVAVLIGIYWIYRMKGLRWFALSIFLIQLWTLLFASFVASMALTGTWL